MECLPYRPHVRRIMGKNLGKIRDGTGAREVEWGDHLQRRLQLNGGQLAMVLVRLRLAEPRDGTGQDRT